LVKILIFLHIVSAAEKWLKIQLAAAEKWRMRSVKKIDVSPFLRCCQMDVKPFPRCQNDMRLEALLWQIHYNFPLYIIDDGMTLHAAAQKGMIMINQQS
jgi:hypothetical protein